MKSKVREELRKSVVISVGWLFADLLLALAMLFLAVNTISLPNLPPVRAVTPKHPPTPTAIPPQRLEQNHHGFIITINHQKLLQNDAGEKSKALNQIRGQNFLRGRSAGLIIVYGGAPTTNDIGTAMDIAKIIYLTVTDPRNKDATFAKVSTYDPLYLLGGNFSEVRIDIFLFAH